jgi:DNA segregation ATPase FtsK/SpoIIIE, S-DNA-T family
MATVRGAFQRAVAPHREALGLVRAARDALERDPQEPRFGAESMVRQSALVAELQQAAEALTLGWGTAGWDWLAGGRRPVASRTPGSRQALLRIGTGHPVPEGFPVLVPFFGVGHLCLDADAGDARISGLIRSVLLRTLGDSTVGSVRVLAVDAPSVGPTFTPLLPLVEVDLMARPVTDAAGLRAVLSEAEEHVRRAAAVPDPTTLVVAVAAFPQDTTDAEIARLAALSRSGHRAGVQLVVAGYPGPGVSWAERPPLENATVIRNRGQFFQVGDPPGHVLSGGGRGLNCPVRLDTGPPEDLLGAVCRQVAARAAQQRSVAVQELFATDLCQESSVAGLRTMIGREGRETAWLALDDATPHWLIGGRTGSGRTAFLLDALYGLVSRYGPDELALHLLDLSEGVSFTELAPTPGDPSWVPQARTVAVESDREYATAVLAALGAEMDQRAAALREAGLTQLAQLRAARPDLALPRVVTVVDACDVLLAGSDPTARRARALLADVARRGRAHGVHLILSGQTSAGLERLLADERALFGQFTLRVALAGGGAVLTRPDPAADALPVGTAVVEDVTAVAGTHRQVRFPDAAVEPIRRLRSQLWQQRAPGDDPPTVFAGSERQLVDDDPGWARLQPGGRRRLVVLGRSVDVGLPTAAFPLDTSPGRHLAVLGPTEVGADLLHAAVLGLARQHAPGTAEFVLAGLVAVADEVVDAAADAVRAAGHRCSEVELTGLRDVLARLAHPDPEEFDLAEALAGPPTGQRRAEAAYVVVWGADALAGGLRGAVDPRWGSTGLQDLQTVLQEGPAHGTHLLSWWRSARRFRDDLGDRGRDDVAGLVALNVAAPDLAELTGEDLGWHPRPNRALLVDRHLDTTTLFIPFVRAQRRGESR